MAAEAPRGAPRIDAHQHFWSVARGDYSWLDPADPVLGRDYRPADLAPLLARHRIDATVLVQAAPTAAETDYMLGIADATHWVSGVVGWVDFEDPGERRRLEHYAAHPKLVGVRPMIQDIADPDWMLRPDIDWAFRALVGLDLAFDALGFPRHLDNFLRLFGRHPDLRIVVDHCLKPDIAGGGFDAWAAGIARIAAETPAACKLSGLVTEAGPGWTAAALRPYADHVLACFGPQRLLWGSDWPVCTLAASYDAWLAAAEALTAGLPAADRDAVFGGNAARFYRLAVAAG